jgi:hypothetical protein
MGDAVIEEPIFQKITDSSTKLKAKFKEYLRNSCKANDFDFDGGFDLDIDVMIEELIFGIESKSDNTFNTAKVDYSKNKNLIKSIILNHIYDPGAIDTIKDIITAIEEYCNHVFTLLQDIYIDNSNDAILTTFIDIVENISWNASHIRSLTTNLKKLVRNSKEKTENNIDINKFMKQDSLKRYYFHHVYDLKNQVKVFDTKNMIFGETNNIMYNFDKIMDFIFEEFSGMYILINTNAKAYLKHLQINKKSTS